MGGYTKLFSDIVESSLWRESPHICKVWITLLALSDSEGFIRGSEGWLALRCNLDLKVCREALEKFQNPDVHSRTPDNEGRRIEKTPDGWVILNYVFYREQTGHQLSSDHRRTYQREWMRKKRECQQLSTTVDGCKPSASASASESSSESSPEGDARGGWTLDQCMAAAAPIGMPADMIAAFWSNFAAVDWIDAKGRKITNLPAALAKWKANEPSHGKPFNGSPTARKPTITELRTQVDVMKNTVASLPEKDRSVMWKRIRAAEKQIIEHGT